MSHVLSARPHATHALRLASALIVLTSVLLAGCAQTKIEGTPIRVGSADTPEAQMLGQLTFVMLQEHGYPVVDRTSLRDERAARQALVAGSVDIGWAYTGDIWTIHLDHDIPIASPDILYQRVRDEDALNGITWLSPAPHGRSLAIMMAPDHANELDIVTLTDLSNHVRAKDAGLTLITPESLYAVSTGVRGLERVYGFEFRQDHVVISDAAERYARVVQGEVDCILGHPFESELLGHDLTTLVDDRDFFVYSNLTVGIRASVLDEYPDLETQLLRLSGALDAQTMIDLERQILEQHKEPADVALKYLRQEHLIGPTPGTDKG